MNETECIEFVNSLLFKNCYLISRIIGASLFVCCGINLFDFKNLSPFFTFKRLMSVFLLILGMRLLIIVLAFNNF